MSDNTDFTKWFYPFSQPSKNKLQELAKFLTNLILQESIILAIYSENGSFVKNLTIDIESDHVIQLIM